MEWFLAHSPTNILKHHSSGYDDWMPVQNQHLHINGRGERGVGHHQLLLGDFCEAGSANEQIGMVFERKGKHNSGKLIWRARDSFREVQGQLKRIEHRPNEIILTSRSVGFGSPMIIMLPLAFIL